MIFLVFILINVFVFQLKEFEGKETAQLVDRYKFLDLYPCTMTELKSIGYTDVGLIVILFDSIKIFH